MDFIEAVNELYDYHNGEIRPGTNITKTVLDELDVCTNAIEYIQVTGSNGKGSTSRLTSSMLQQAGYNVGLYTSPHMNDFRERIQINGSLISKQSVQEFMTEYEAASFETDREPTFFEIMTAMAIWEFNRRGVDIGVLEVGLGGRKDPTSVISPTVSAVTNVTLEHTAYLGDTIAAIATEKSQVAPTAGPTVTACEGDALEVVSEHATELVTVGTDDNDVVVERVDDTIRTQEVNIMSDELTVTANLPLLGDFQQLNVGVAAGIASHFELVTEDAIKRGIETVRWPGRMEILSKSPTVVLDMAQNPGSANKLTETIERFEFEDTHLVHGCISASERTVAQTIENLPNADRVYTCEPIIDPTEAPKTLAALFEAYGYSYTEPYGAVTDAVRAAVANAADDDLVIVTGSLYTVSEARRLWSYMPLAQLSGFGSFCADFKTSSASGVASSIENMMVRLRATPSEIDAVQTALEQAEVEIVEPEVELTADSVDFAVWGTIERLSAAVDTLRNEDTGSAFIGDLVKKPLSSYTSATEKTDRADRGFPAAIDAVTIHSRELEHEPSVQTAIFRESSEAGVSLRCEGFSGTFSSELIARTDRLFDCLVDEHEISIVEALHDRMLNRAIDAGVNAIRPLSGSISPTLAERIASSDTRIILTHNPGGRTNGAIRYDDLVAEVIAELTEELLFVKSFGVSDSQILLSPGIGFSKLKRDNTKLSGELDKLVLTGYHVYVNPNTEVTPINRNRYEEISTEFQESDLGRITRALQ